MRGDIHLMVLVSLFAPTSAFALPTIITRITRSRVSNNIHHRAAEIPSVQCHNIDDAVIDEGCNESLDQNRRQLLGMTTELGASFAASIPASFPQQSSAISADEASRSYDKYASTYDELDGGTAASALGIDAARSSLLSRASGRVLEIGVGTGLNINQYKFASAGDGSSDGVTSLTLVDISDGMLGEAKAKVSAMDIPSHVKIDFVRADATSQLVQLFGEDAFDTVVDTFSLCVMGNQGAKDCLEQMRNVVRPKDGKMLLIENTRSSNPLLGMYQDATANTASQMGGKGCVYNQDITVMIQKTDGLKIAKEEAFAAGLFRSYICVKQ